MVSKRAGLLLVLALTVLSGHAHKSIDDEENEAAAAAAKLAQDQAAAEAVAQQAEVTGEIPADLVDASKKEPFDPIKFAQKFQMESCFLAFFVVCFGVLMVGKSKNWTVAQLWHKKSLPLIRDQFSYVGMEDGQLQVDCEQTSWSEYTFYASGRKNCFYSLYKLDL